MIVAIADTHAVIWYLINDPRLSVSAGQFMDATVINGNEIGVSAITLVEMVYLIEKGRIPPHHFSQVANEFSDPDSMFVEIPIEVKIARAVSRVDVTQVPDMPDRIIAATAVEHNVPVISRDGKIRLSSVKTIW